MMTDRSQYKCTHAKGDIAISQMFFLILAVIVLVILVGFSFFLGGRAEDMLDGIKSLLPDL